MINIETNCTQCGNKADRGMPFCSICGYPLIALPLQEPDLCFTSGIVVELCRRGLVIQSDYGHRELVTTMSKGWWLGLNLGDRVRVMGGPDGEGNFANSAIWRILPDGKEIEIKDDPLRANAATYLIYRLIRLKENVLKKITGAKEVETQR